MIAVASCFSQVLSLIDRVAFARAVRRHQAEHAAKGFTCWEQFVAVLFCRMGAGNSLREICGGRHASIELHPLIIIVVQPPYLWSLLS